MSLKGDKYETADEVETRVCKTVVLYDKEPVYITKVTVPEGENEVARVFYTPLPLPPRGGNMPETRKFLSSKNFDLAPFKMGYFDWNNEAILASRRPIRQYKQGLSEATMSLRTIGGAQPDLSFMEALACKSFLDMVQNKYDNFKNVLERLKDPKVKSVAVSQSFALMSYDDLEISFLLHRGERVAALVPGNNIIRLPEKYKFLKEEAAECGIPLA